MDIKRVTSNQSLKIKTSKKRKFFEFKKLKINSKFKIQNSKLKKIKNIFNTKKKKLSFSLLFILLLILPAYFIFFHNKAGASWWNSDWHYRRSITINSSQIPGDLTNYPMLVSFTDSNLINKAQTDGDDIIFVESNGNKLNHEIEKFNNTTGELVAWVKIPELDGDNDSIIYMYYGNQTTDNQQRPEDVWDENYVSVWHMNSGATAGENDSTRNNYNLSVTGTVGTTDSGKLGKSREITTNGNNYLFKTDDRDLDGMQKLTIQAWVRDTQGDTSPRGIISKRPSVSGLPSYATFVSVSGSRYFYFDNGLPPDSEERLPTDTETAIQNTWQLLHFTFDGTLSSGVRKSIYLNGANAITGSSTQTLITDTDSDLRIGILNDAYPTSWIGQFDEVRILKNALSANWITTEYNNQNSPSTFISLGQEELGPSPVLYLPFDEGFGATAYDESSNRNDGTIVGATWKDESMCKNGKCLEFDGNGDYVEINDNQSLDLDKEVTLEAWIKPTTTDKKIQTILSKEETPTDPTKIYRSVGPSATSAITTGATNSLNITGDKATFQTALPDNIGVGDVIQYDDDDDSDIDSSDSLAFIVERITSYEYRITNASGTTPTPINSDNNWSIFRAYTSLANAESGIENIGIDSDLRNFDDWTAGGDSTTDDVGKDLVSANQQWNIACYANGTTADTTTPVIEDWITSASNNINVYTPINGNEVGTSQRHAGKWDNSKYYIQNGSDNSMRISENYTKISGIQVKNTKGDNNPYVVRVVSGDNSIFDSNILVLAMTGVANGVVVVNQSSNVFYHNNMLYSTGSYLGKGIVADSNRTLYAYNNTIYKCTTALDEPWGEIISKNNIIQNVTTDFNNVVNSYSFNNLTNSTPSAANAIGTTYTTGTTNGTTASKLINSGETFITKRIQIGSIIKNTTDNTYTYVTAIDSETQLSVANDIFVSGEGYAIYTNKYGTASFVSTTSGSEDFHLNPTDTVAKNSGADLSQDNIFPFASDIDGQSRFTLNTKYQIQDTAWDIGADEAQATQIYRSVSPNKTDALETGDGNAMTINGNIVSFQRALADNVGVGDAIQYDTNGDGTVDAIAFIVERISNYEYRITNASGGVPTQVINDKDWSIFRAYTSLFNAEAGTENTGIDSDLRNFDTWTGGKDLVTSKEQWNIACYANGTTADTTAVTIDGWTTGIQNFVKVYTPVSENEVGESQRHLGKWSEDKYKTEINSGRGAIEIKDDSIKIEGLQIKFDATVTQGGGIFTEYNELNVNNCYIETSGITTAGIAIVNASNSISKIWNNIVKSNTVYNHNNHSGIYLALGTSGKSSYVYNNTAIGYSRGIYASSSTNPCICKNNLAKGQSYLSYEIIVASGSDYNASDDGSSTGGAHDKINQTFNFVDEANDDFHLSKTDTAARNAGANLSNDPYLSINSDIDGEVRDPSSKVGMTGASGIFDIGADEATATKIYRSVGPNNTTALATDESHENTVSVTSGIATFEVDLPDRIGVGDAVLIDTGGTANTIDSSDTLLFIHGRIDSKNYTLRTHTGAVPSNISSNDTYQIFRAYTSLANAEAGTKNTSIPITTFNGGNRDLVTNNEEWNIACYGDAVDMTSFDISGWTTGLENFINIYTPTKNNEVGISQRHNGLWSSDKYQMNLSGIGLRIKEEYVKVTGIQVATSNKGITTDNVSVNSRVEISNCIVKGVSITVDDAVGIGTYFTDYVNLYAWNNIIYDFISGTKYEYAMLGYSTNGENHFYNNTIVNCRVGIRSSTSEDSVIAKNNIVSEIADAYFGDFDPRSDFNATNINDSITGSTGTNNKINQTFQFRDSTNKDFRLAMNDTAAKGAGINLSNDLNLPISSDIEGEIRPSLVSSNQSSSTNYDIGADQISTTIHNNYSLNLNTNYPQVSYSTGFDGTDEAMPRLYEENFSSGDSDLNPNEWSHIAYKRSNDQEEIYINGSKKDSKTISNFLKTNNGKLYIGSKNTSSKDSFKGFLDEIKIYPYARTEAEIKKDKVQGSSGRASSRATEGTSVSMGDTSSSLSDGLVGYWKMDETTGTTVVDSSGNNNNGTLTNAQETGTSDASGNTTTNMLDTDGTLATTDDAYNGMILRFTAACGSITSGTERTISDYTGASKTFIVSAALASVPNSCAYEIDHQVGGKFGGGVKFDKFNDYARVASPDFVEDKENITFSAWAKATIASPASGYFIRAVVNNNQEVLSLYVQANNNLNWRAYNNNGDYSLASTGDKFADGAWHHLVGVYRQGVAELYVDGNFISKGSAISGNTRTGGSGEHFSMGAEWPGIMDEVRTYTRALSPEEIKQLYNYAPGPVLHLKLDEKNGTTAYDSSGNGYNANLNNTVWETGKVGSGINIPAPAGTAHVQNSSDLTDNWGAFTIGAWVKTDRPTSTDGPLYISKERSGFGGWRLLKDRNNATGKFIFRFDNHASVTQQINSTNIWPTDLEWHYISVAYDGVYLRMYGDGNQIATPVAATGTVKDLTHEVCFGGGWGGSACGNADTIGKNIDDVRIYNYARTQEQILEDMGAQSSSISGGSGKLQKPILDLSFDEGQGSTTFDGSGNNNNGTLSPGAGGTNTTATAMWDKGGKKGGAMEFDGTDDSVTIPDMDVVDNAEELSVCAWVYQTSLSGTNDIYQNNTAPSNSGIRLYQTGTGNAFMAKVVEGGGDSSAVYLTGSNDKAKLNDWTHVCTTYKENIANGLKLYVDGKFDVQTSTVGVLDINSFTTNETIGGSSGNFNLFNGKIDELKVYSYALSEDEIKTLYNDSSAMTMGNDEARNNNGTEVTGANKDYCIPGDTAKCDKPVLELKMDEMTGTTVKDTSGNGGNGTINGASWESNGKIGSALSFDGVGDYVSGSIGGVTGYPVTLSAWTMATQGDNGSHRSSIAIGVDFDEYIGIGWTGANGIPSVAARNTSFTSYEGPAQGINKWTHIAGVFHSATSRDLYINGRLVGNHNISVNFPASANLFEVGRVLTHTEYYAFEKVDEVRVYNYARTPAQIAWDYNRGKPIGHWKMDEASGTQVDDWSGNAYHGTMNGTIRKNESECKSGKCLYFNGLDQTRIDADAEDNMNNLTACTWLKADSLINPGNDDMMYVIEKSFVLRILNDGKIDFRRPTSVSYPEARTSSSISVNQWYRICGVYYGVGVVPKIFINGEEQNLSLSVAGSGTQTNDSSTILRIGADVTNPFARNFYGYIDDPKIYNYALSEEQIKLDYNGGAVNFR